MLFKESVRNDKRVRGQIVSVQCVLCHASPGCANSRSAHELKCPQRISNEVHLKTNRPLSSQGILRQNSFFAYQVHTKRAWNGAPLPCFQRKLSGTGGLPEALVGIPETGVSSLVKREINVTPLRSFYQAFQRSPNRERPSVGHAKIENQNKPSYYQEPKSASESHV